MRARCTSVTAQFSSKAFWPSVWVLTIITSFQVFSQPYILTGGGPGVSTQTMVMYMYQKGFQFFELGSASAIASVLFLIIVLITGLQFLGQRRWVHYDD